MSLLRALSSVALSALVAACGIGSDIDDYAGGPASRTSGGAGAPAAGRAGAGQAGASAGQAGAGQAGASAGQAGAGRAGASAGQAGAGQAGASAGQAGASAGQAGAGQAGASAGQAGASGKPGAGGGAIGAPCTKEESFSCLGAAQPVVLKCTGGVWQSAIVCAEGKRCDSTAPLTQGDRCAPIVPECASQAPGAVVCKGAERVTCGPDLVTSTREVCGSPALCALGKGSSCAKCEPGTFSCDGAVLSKCDPTKLEFTPLQTCASPEQCNDASGACTSEICAPGTYYCNGELLLLCKADGTSYNLVSGCSGGYCDAAGGQCDKCLAGTQLCVDANTAGTCSSNGQSVFAQSCGAATPYCVGAGVCAACRADTDCPVPKSPCQARACVSGKCNVVPRPAGDTVKSLVGDCLSGKCDGAGGELPDLTDVPFEDGDPCTRPVCAPGPAFAPDNEGQGCGMGEVCHGGVCGCVPKAKADACKTLEGDTIICGNVPDGCGGMIPCGTCLGVKAVCCATECAPSGSQCPF
ncbi:MAG: hypothetical protein IT374_19230 [Polyangiaceae bacterium]|nr:hypothetical protein [Polyangiaceae bacterium]